MASEAVFIFPNQLFQEHPALNKKADVYLIEEHLFFTQYLFHKQKLLLHRITMKEYEKFLISSGYSVHYISAREKKHDIRILLSELKDLYDKFLFVNPVDNYLERRIRKSVDVSKLKFYENPNFLYNSQEVLVESQHKKSNYLQAEFYKRTRLKYSLLLESDKKPKGGKWSFDAENRSKFPKKEVAPPLPQFEPSSFFQESVTYINTYFSKNPGYLESFIYPVTHNAAKQNFHLFLNQRFGEFGTYEDAISVKEPYLFHSLLTPALNIGLINPQEVIRECLKYEEKIPMNSLEGFVRQVCGWREFIRVIYVLEGSRERTTNFWKFNRNLSKLFYTGETGITPVDFVIKKVLQTGYCHHIERLMVLGNFFLLCEIDPDEVYMWFMELFIDSYDWVMVPNVYGMSQFADGGVMATKPYISGSNYIKKMSDFPGGKWEEIWDGLFWRFIGKNIKYFSANHRTSMMANNWKKMPDDKKKIHLKNAEIFLKKIS